MVPAGIDGRMYRDLMQLSMTNGKLCSLRFNFKQDIYKQFQGETRVECELVLSPTANVCTHVFGLNVLDDKKTVGVLQVIAPGKYLSRSEN